jgi:hypothetical protein
MLVAELNKKLDSSKSGSLPPRRRTHQFRIHKSSSGMFMYDLKMLHLLKIVFLACKEIHTSESLD